jgi:hypothetical protein
VNKLSWTQFEIAWNCFIVIAIMVNKLLIPLWMEITTLQCCACMKIDEKIWFQFPCHEVTFAACV